MDSDLPLHRAANRKRKERMKLLKERVDQLLVEAFQMGFDLDEVLKLVGQSELAARNPKKGD